VQLIGAESRRREAAPRTLPGIGILFLLALPCACPHLACRHLAFARPQARGPHAAPQGRQVFSHRGASIPGGQAL